MSIMSKFRVGQHVIIGTHTPAYGAFSSAHEKRGTPILGLGVLIRRISQQVNEDGETFNVCEVQAHPLMADDKIGGTIQVLREEDLVEDLRSKFQPGQRVRVVAETPSHNAWRTSLCVRGHEGVVVSPGVEVRGQDKAYPSGFVVTVNLDGTNYSQSVNPEDLEPLEPLTKSRMTTITETRAVQVGQTFTVNLSEREAALLAYLLGRVPTSLLRHNTTLYDSLSAAIGDDTSDWEGPGNILPSMVDSDKIRARLWTYSNRYK